MKRSRPESQALVDVWEMKDRAHEETKHLSGVAYFEYVRAQVAVRWQGAASLPRARFPELVRHSAPLEVAEQDGEYVPGNGTK